MPLGWIDFSQSERNKVLSVLELLSEKSALDELGIAPVRDGFANIFFPGTSTIQRRAKYFMIVPYALKDLEYSSETNPNKLLRTLDEVERKCGEILLTGEDREGIIGKRSLSQNRWVKQTPADTYWAGLRSFGIFTDMLSLTEYVRAMCSMKRQKAALIQLGNRNDNSGKGDWDDKDAGDLFRRQFWNIPTYYDKWIDDLSIKLTKEEGSFLKKQIITSFPTSMLAFILRNNLTEIIGCESFQEMGLFISDFPDQMQKDYRLACHFSEFLFVLRTIYNMMISDGKNERANDIWNELRADLRAPAAVDLESIFVRLGITTKADLCTFLRKCRSLMMNADLEGMKTEIKRRERYLKDSRAKTLHPGEFDPETWIGGGMLDYRFSNARVIIRDIFESEGIYAES